MSQVSVMTDQENPVADGDAEYGDEPDERTELYNKMRDMVVEDAPYMGSMARTRFYLVNPRLKNFKPSEDFYTWIKYMNVE